LSRASSEEAFGYCIAVPADILGYGIVAPANAIDNPQHLLSKFPLVIFLKKE